MIAKHFYLTKEIGNGYWYYIGDPLNPHTTFDTGIVQVEDRTEIRVDNYGAYVVRFIEK